MVQPAFGGFARRTTTTRTTFAMFRLMALRTTTTRTIRMGLRRDLRLYWGQNK